MKKLIVVLFVGAISVTACKKQPLTGSPAATAATTETEADFKDSKAKIAGLQMKNSETGLDFDYDLIIKKVAENKYQASMKINGLMLNDKKV